MKDLKLGQYFDTDDMASPSQFGNVKWPSSHFMGRLVYYRSASLFRKVANFLDIDLKFSEFISDVYIDNPA